ncbi:MAG TPA: SRPBCC domain-containing protein [Cyclobacteriaceae bacterium]|nr:SRPBCC domain-containing protein [Cyclobacteriaceae bacterium]HMV09427.1 SRPBCC domain-containing protein [Cyclobacteriaceae bacterium]HMV91472.1 SRPBCC domain-containing protein [Cyclobacteriaceae bacterium]HMX02448.1 SRPBCC domain-containing protein [Cyclobacteriaceae bacterium]HMX51064.1 SRPBCC domain-containing protein [Cyclobacteriaceae bacterium]
MKPGLQFDFIVNKQDLTVTVRKEFAAPQKLVWDTFTKADLLDQWWAPKPWLSRTKEMEFKKGGRRLYAMVSPDGSQEGWAIQSYTSVSPISNFKYFDAFCDKEGNVKPEDPGSDWNLNFTEKNGVTTVDIMIQCKTLEDMEATMKMGFKEGFTMTLNSLDELLEKLSK